MNGTDRKLAAQGLGVIITLVILYVASIGPVLRLTSFAGERIKPVHGFYRPLFHASSHGWLPHFDTYLQLWKVDLRLYDDGSDWFIVNPAAKSG